MISPRAAFELIAELMQEAAKADMPPTLQHCVIAAHTHAILQASFLRRAELRAAPAHETVQ
jgi:hypothetical protein